MLKIRGMSISENLLMGVNRFGHGLTGSRCSSGGSRPSAAEWGITLVTLKLVAGHVACHDSVPAAAIFGL